MLQFLSGQFSYEHDKPTLESLGDDIMRTAHASLFHNATFNSVHWFHGTGSGHFERVTDRQPLKPKDTNAWVWSLALADINNDAWPDLVVASDYGQSRLLLNDGLAQG